MRVFQHPHLTRGIVKTARGAFTISRGLVEMPDEIGEALGWRTLDSDDDEDSARVPRPAAQFVLGGPTEGHRSECEMLYTAHASITA